MNYRNEPVGFRVYDPPGSGPDGKPGTQADGFGGDLAFALQSRTDRKIARLNVQPTPGAAGAINGTQFPPPLNAGGVTAGDPFTPLLRAYFGDPVRIKIQAGGHEESHSASINGMKWLQGGSGFGFAPNSGWRNSQHAGISEQFTFASPDHPGPERRRARRPPLLAQPQHRRLLERRLGPLPELRDGAAHAEAAPQRRDPPLQAHQRRGLHRHLPGHRRPSQLRHLRGPRQRRAPQRSRASPSCPPTGRNVMNVGGKNAAGKSALNPNGGTLVVQPARHGPRARRGPGRSTTRPRCSGSGPPTSWPAAPRPRRASTRRGSSTRRSPPAR